MIIKTKEELMLFTLQMYLDKPKVKVLEHVKDKSLTATELSKIMNISPPLVSFYINGNKKTKGLFDLGLIKRTHNDKGLPNGFIITNLGKEILKIMR